MLTVRKDLGGHASYQKYRAALEVLEYVDALRLASEGDSREEFRDNAIERFRFGDRVKIMKESRLKGKFATVIDAKWHGLVKVEMADYDAEGQVKAFKDDDLKLVSKRTKDSVIVLGAEMPNE